MNDKQKQNEAVALIIGMIRDGELDGREDELWDAFKRRHQTLNRQARFLFHDQDRVAFKTDGVRPVHLRGATGTVQIRPGYRGQRIPVLVDADANTTFAGAIVQATPNSIEKLEA